MKKLAVGTLALALGVVGLAPATFADDRDDDRHGCKDIHATITDSKTTNGCTSPFGFCAAGVSTGDHGLNGTTYFTLDGFNGKAGGVPYGATSGILVYTTDKGTLTVRESGLGNMGADALSGHGASIEDVISGTGRFAGATGTLFLASTAANGSFVAHVTGQLCLP
jgi:hypothetical protein